MSLPLPSPELVTLLPSKAAQARKAIVGLVGALGLVLTQAATLLPLLPTRVGAWVSLAIAVATALGIYRVPNAPTDGQYAELVARPGTDEHRGPGMTEAEVAALPTWDHTPTDAIVLPAPRPSPSLVGQPRPETVGRHRDDDGDGVADLLR